MCIAMECFISAVCARYTKRDQKSVILTMLNVKSIKLLSCVCVSNTDVMVGEISVRCRDFPCQVVWLLLGVKKHGPIESVNNLI
jgi:hypothetical protein